jgi:GH43 family beta-xylosidase
MRNFQDQTNTRTFLNPVYPYACPDPYVLKYLNQYWCYCTGLSPDGRYFGILHSRDLLNWRAIGGAMEPLNNQATCYWAPEVIYENGRFLMYYSVGNEATMQIRVAIAEHPAGPFVDSGAALTNEVFAIDPHVFKDDDGTRYLFYATDFLEHTYIGTGTVVDRMIDAFTLAGEPHPVTRARFDWQVYDPNRLEKGGVRWHTVEGPFVLKRKGLYFQMFSGGNWQNKSYGVSYAISDRVINPEEWQQFADGEKVVPILRTIPELVIGPGHNSAVSGTDNMQMYCIYHRWADDSSDRVLAIDPMDWAGERMLVMGPSTTPQPAPNLPTFFDFFESNQEAGLGDSWQCTGGKWRVHEGAALQGATNAIAEARCLSSAASFVAEVSLRLLGDPNGNGEFGIQLLDEHKASLSFTFSPQNNEAIVRGQLAEGTSQDPLELRFTLPQDFQMTAYHLLRVEVNQLQVHISLDENLVKWQGRLRLQPHFIALWTQDAAAAFSGFALTHGWQDLFTELYTDPEMSGWQAQSDKENWRIQEQQLFYIGSENVASIITKSALPEDYELVVNVRLVQETYAEQAYGFLPVLDGNQSGTLLTVARNGAGWTLKCDDATAPQQFSLAPDFDPFHYQQFRFRKQGSALTIRHEAQFLGQIKVPQIATQIGLYASGNTVTFDMVRVTAIKE